MSEEKYTNDFLNLLNYYCKNETIVSFYLLENKIIVGKISATEGNYIEVQTLKHEYQIPMKNIKFVSIEKGRIGK